MILRSILIEAKDIPFPRAGGGDPKQITAKEYDRWLFPSRAGVIFTMKMAEKDFLAFPRAGGGDPIDCLYNPMEMYFSPRGRG